MPSTQAQTLPSAAAPELVEAPVAIAGGGLARCSEKGAIPAGVTDDGFTCFVPLPTSRIVYVSSSSGSDDTLGLSPERPVASLERGISLLREGRHDFLLLKRGDTWTAGSLNTLGSGESRERPVVVASYGSAPARPRLAMNTFALDHNGGTRKYQALLGLEIIPAGQVPPAAQAASGAAAGTAPNAAPPAGSAPTGAGPAGTAPTGASTPAGEAVRVRGGLRLVGGGEDLLIEDCHLKYTEIIVQSYGGRRYRGVTFRRNVVERAYHPQTCGTGPKYRPSGMYSYDVDELTLEDNVFDHNGWNVEESPGACATMYNHNLYLNARKLVVKHNVLSRASSMGLKLASAERGSVSDVLVQENLFIEGEIGVSAGGNAKGPGRFVDVRVIDNVFWGIGSTRPTGRDFAWAVDVTDNEHTEVTGNLFAMQHHHDNSYGVQVSGVAQNDVLVQDNVFVEVSGGAIVTRGMPDFSGIRISNNTIYARQAKGCAVAHHGPLAGITFTGTRWAGSGDHAKFCRGREAIAVAEWSKWTGDQPKAVPPLVHGALRGPAELAAKRGLPARTDALLRALLERPAGVWPALLSPRALHAELSITGQGLR